MTEPQSPAVPAPAAPAPAVPASRRRPAMLMVTGLTLVAGLGYAAWWFLFERHHESTDNAYVQAPMVQITPQVGGTVLAVLVDDTDVVKVGQPLVKLDPADAKLALERAESQLAQTVREVRTLYVNNATLAANIRLREAEVARLQGDLARASDDVARRKPLLATGAVAAEEVKHAESAANSSRNALAGAQSALAAAQQQASSNQALTEGTPVDKHPNVERAASAVREAWLALQRTELPAPVAGQVARRTVQVGQRIAPGTPLMSLVPLDQVWVDANFKEVQLRQMRLGQPVKLTADLYGSKVVYTGRVAGLGAGTGAAFALLPAQNATGNWIKVVQRVPVRVELDARQLAEHPLRVGLSMEADVDVADQTGAPVLAGTSARASSRTTAFETTAAEADRRVKAIIAGNLGRASGAVPVSAARP
ncbi:MAG: efflux RND transporter periplasmic adaptor subunit [Ideonella sp.]|nr:efflux RND transporter periplasmic adaptor subunit [Ideonella sp.]